MKFLFANKPIDRLQFVHLADKNEVWEMLESWVINAFAAEGVSLLKGVVVSDVLRSFNEVDEASDVEYLFQMPTLIGFEQSKANPPEDDVEDDKDQESA